MSQENRFFIRRFRKLVANFLFPAVLIFILAFNMEYKSADKEVQEKSRQSVETIEENLRLVTGNIFMQNEYLTNMVMMSSTLKRVLQNELLNYKDTIYLRSLQAMFISMKNSYEYVNSTIIYFDDCDRYITSDYAIQNISGDEEWRKIYLEMEEDQTSTVAVSMDSGQKIITFCQRLFTRDGCLITNIELNKLQKMMQSYSYMDGEIIYLLDDKGNILIQSETKPSNMPDIEEYLVEYEKEKGVSSGSGQTKWIKYSPLTKYLVSMSTIGEPGICILSVMPDSTFYANIMQRLKWFVVACLVDLAVILVLAFITTKRSFDHIRTILWMFEEAEAGNSVEKPKTRVKDEYDIILDNIVQMFLNTSYLNLQLNERQYRQENAELRALQLQINPHFLFNTLQTLDIEVGKNGKREDIRHIIRCLSDILKYALEDTSKMVTFEEELGYLKKYVVMQQYRFGTRFIIYYDIEDELRQVLVFRLMLQPILENSLLHGIRQTSEEREYIIIEAKRKGELMEIVVSDTGVGMEQSQLQALRERIVDPESKSIGLTNLNRRLALYYGKNSQLKIESCIGEGTTISFAIPITTEPSCGGEGRTI